MEIVVFAVACFVSAIIWMVYALMWLGFIAITLFGMVFILVMCIAFCRAWKHLSFASNHSKTEAA